MKTLRDIMALWPFLLVAFGLVLSLTFIIAVALCRIGA